MSHYTYRFKGNGVWFNLASQSTKLQSSTCTTYEKYLWYLFKMAVLTLKSGILDTEGVRKSEVYIIFWKKHHHLIRLILVYGCDVCVQIYLCFVFFILFSTSHIYTLIIVTSSSFKSHHPGLLTLLLVCSTCRNLCFH